LSSDAVSNEGGLKGKPLWRFNGLRATLALYFFVYAYVVAKSLVPLPDEPARINFLGVFCVTAGIIISFSFLIIRYRLFLGAVLCFLPLATHQLSNKIKFLEMMLESTDVVVVTRYSLGFVMLVLLTPPVLRMFDQPVSSYTSTPPLFMKKGFPF